MERVNQYLEQYDFLIGSQIETKNVAIPGISQTNPRTSEAAGQSKIY